MHTIILARIAAAEYRPRRSHPALESSARLVWQAGRLYWLVSALLHVSVNTSDSVRLARLHQRAFDRWQRRQRADLALWERTYPPRAWEVV